MNRLEKINCEGCENISDRAFKFLLNSSQAPTSCSEIPIEEKGQFKSIEEMLSTIFTHKIHDNQGNTNLQYINLSGCWSLTDSGLE